MVTTRGQSSCAVPVVVVERKAKVKTKARKDVASSKIKPGVSENTPTIRGKKRHISHLSTANINPHTSRRSKRHTASPSFNAHPDDLSASDQILDDLTPIELPRSDSPAPKTESNALAAVEVNSDAPHSAETILSDPPTTEAPVGELAFTEAPLPAPSSIVALPDDPAASEASLSDQLSLSLSEDDERAIHSPFLEPHVPRPSVRTLTRSPEMGGAEGHLSFSAGAHRFFQGVILHQEDNDVYERNLALWNAIQEQNRLIAETSLELKTEAMPHLEGTAMIVLYIIAKATPSQIKAMATNPQSEEFKEYDFAKTSFLKLRSLISSTKVMLNAHDMGLLLPEHDTGIMKTNLATFISGVFGIPGKQDIGFYHLNEYFLPTLVADGKLTKEKQNLFLDLKTHAYISGLESGGVKDEILDELFPSDLDQQLLANRGGSAEQTARDVDFIERCDRRCGRLMKFPHTKEGLEVLNKKFVWEKYLANLSSWLKKHFEPLTGETFETRAQKVHNMLVTLQYIEPSEAPEAKESKSLDIAQSTEDDNARRISNEAEIAEKAARAADLVMQDFGNQTTAASQPYRQIQFQHPIQQNGYYVFDNASQSLNPQQSSHTEQTEASLQTQYHQARLATNTKANPNTRRPGAPSSRRPWNAEEEAALMQGLDDVGPHWSQILALYGGDGTISKVLKDRNQVQLKDKARNLKLWFLKQGKPVPESLSQVTGELKTRAPAVASRQNSGHPDMTHARTYRRVSNAALPASSTSPEKVAAAQFPTSSRRRSGQGMTQELNQSANLGNHQNVSPSVVANTILVGDPEAELEAALAAAERAGLESEIS